MKKEYAQPWDKNIDTPANSAKNCHRRKLLAQTIGN